MWKEISKEDFDNFIESYPNKLTKDVARICEPPQVGFYDFTLDDKCSITSKVAYMYDDWIENIIHYFLREI